MTRGRSLGYFFDLWPESIGAGMASSVVGGEGNIAGTFSSVVGGVENIARGNASTIAGGWMNTASGLSPFLALCKLRVLCWHLAVVGAMARNKKVD